MYRKKCYVYIVTNPRHTVLYVGVTCHLRRRIEQHRCRCKGFTRRFNCTKLVYVEYVGRPGIAIAREKQLKAGSRQAKLRLIEGLNPTWRDLFEEI